MGTWGPAIFSDDLAIDLREDWKELIGDNHTPEEATKMLIKEYESEVIDSEEFTVFWLALASIQWKTGRLQKKVKEKALKIIESEENLKVWIDCEARPADIKKRQKALLKLKEELNSMQPIAKKIPKAYWENSEFHVGDIFSYKHVSGKNALFRVIGIHEDKGGRSSICEMLNWFQESLPIRNNELDLKRIEELPTTYLTNNGVELTKFMLAEIVKKYAVKLDRIELVSSNNKIKQEPERYSVVLWRELDDSLSERFEK